MHIKTIVLVAFIVINIPSLAVCGDYEECVMEKMKDANSNYAVMVLKETCYALTLPKKCREEQIAKDIGFYNKIWDEYQKKLKIKNKDYYDNLEPWKRKLFEELSSKSGIPHTEAVKICVDRCKKENYLSRTFGECSNDW